VEKVVRSSVFLKHDYNVLDLGVTIRIREGIALVAAICPEKKAGTGRSEHKIKRDGAAHSRPHQAGWLESGGNKPRKTEFHSSDAKSVGLVYRD
jgi:hypothetical protein